MCLIRLTQKYPLSLEIPSDFVVFMSYCFIATGTGHRRDQNNRVGGRCLGHKEKLGYVYEMKLIIKVCADGEAGTEKCPICMTAACYNKGM